MPFLPLVVVLQVLGRGASFALGWATSLFFGQIPGDKRYVVSAAIVLSLAWFVLLTVAGPIAVGAIFAHWLGLLDLDAEGALSPVEMGVVAVFLVVLPPIVTLMGELSRFHESISIGRWLRQLPASYGVALSLGVSMLLMLIVTPFTLLRRWREGRSTLHVPLVVKEGKFEELADDMRGWIEELGEEQVAVTRQTGMASWPMRSLRYAAARLLRSVVLEDPILIRSGRIEVGLFATDLSVTAPKDSVYRLRSALHKRLALTQAFLTWSEVPQRHEAKLMELRARRDLSLRERVAALEAIQEEIDAAEIKADEWDVLYRLRLQSERDAYEAAAKRAPDTAERQKVHEAAAAR